MAHPKIIVVGGGLAGLVGHHQDCRDGRSRRPLLHRAGQAVSFGVRAGRHQRRQEPEGRRRLHLAALRRHHLRRRLPRQPAAGEDDVRHGARHHRPARPHGRSLQPHARRTARLPPLRRHALQPHGIRRRHHRPAAALCARRAGAALRGRRQGQQVRSLGIPLRASSTTQRVCRGICAMDLRTMQVHTFPAEAVIIATGGIGAIFGKSTNSVVCTGSAQSALYQQGAYYANGEFIQVHPTSIPGEDKLRLMSESARGEGGRVWVPKQAGRQARSQEHSRERALVLPGRVVSQVRQPGAARCRDPRHPQGGVRAPPRHRRPADGLSRPDAHRPQNPRPQTGRHPRDLREVCRRRSARRADEDLPRHALHHGRPVGGLQPEDQHRRPVRLPASATTRSTAPIAWERIR